MTAAESAWENEGGSLRLAAPNGSGEGSNDNGAARELARRSRDLPGARFRLRKGIPVSAGLGGGSADGAAALIALDRLWGLHLPAVNLQTMAAEVGSDVPFCIGGGTSVATERGDKIREVPSRGATWWVVGIDHERLATQDVYNHFDELDLAASLEGRWPTELLEALVAGDPDRLAAALHNDLEPAAFDLLRDLHLLGAVAARLGRAAAGSRIIVIRSLEKQIVQRGFAPVVFLCHLDDDDTRRDNFEDLGKGAV